MATNSIHQTSIAIPASSPVEASRKAVALSKIAENLNLESLNTLASLAAKPGADGKLKKFSGVLASF